VPKSGAELAQKWCKTGVKLVQKLVQKWCKKMVKTGANGAEK
jgi:hypothetical protein